VLILKKEVKVKEKNVSSKFGAFNGVFLPTFLSIIGVILFLRLGYIVGSAGILSTLVIILLAISVTIATGLSLSSITTNIRIGSGGAYSIISKTLGLEIGGSIGIPLYIAQIFSVALYLFGFMEVWKFVFPSHNSLLILAFTFSSLFLLTFISTKIAVKAQYGVFIILAVALASLLFSGNWIYGITHNPLIGNFSNISFWALFALFFPAVTGIMAGVGLSGELQDPKKQIPLGLISAMIVSTLIYLLVALWLNYSAPASELISNNLIMVKLAYFAPLIIAGILASTFSSALTTFVAAPRLLQSMASKSLFPGSKYLLDSNSHLPQKAIIISSIPIIIALLVADLNAVAPIITMFFLITYAILNIVVFVEQSIGLVSFRPTLSIPRIVPLYGALSSLIFMFMINSMAGFFALLFVALSYLYLVKRKLSSTDGDIRSGLFIAFSEWASRKVLTLPESTKHTWKPNVLIPVVNTATLLGNFPVIKSITYPNGNMTVLGLNIKEQKSSPEELHHSVRKRKMELKELPELVKKFGSEGIFTSASTITASSYLDAVTISLEAIESQTFSPNILFLPFKPKKLPLKALQKIFKVAKKHNTGIVLSDRDEEIGLGSEEDIHVWISSSSLKNDIFEDKKYDLSLLIAYRLHRNWAGNITIWMCVSEDKKAEAQRYMKQLLYESRFPTSTKLIISTESFSKTLTKAPKGDVHIIPVSTHSEINNLRKISNSQSKSFFFVADSGKEDILA
jgi:solute carrier family 12 (sodium/potassium/chloride transporter), member 2